ncbi:GT4 family glycosyltransferase PelF [Mesoaciditoga lauensis]|uniref:GT4 family glycosyltransferase PelF n=1 Tax=Mesoaciditoga lauensis TaxID=1495039 RepID=UPI000561F4F4|nr:GT4 family glycosyltransferase PelF [Mesoaciditoga lauensis]
MKVGVIVEGTYPYVMGGVSSWLQTLMENLPEIEFKIIYLGPREEDKKFAYEIPPNVSEIWSQSLFSYFPQKNSKVKDANLLSSKIRNLIDINWATRIDNAIEILHLMVENDFLKVMETKEFWDAMIDVYHRYLPDEGFTRYFWTVKGLFLPIVNSFSVAPPPKCDIYHSITTGYASLKAISGKYRYNSKVIITEHGIYHREREREIITSRFIPEIYKAPWIELFKLISAVSYRETDFLTTLFKKNQIFQLELGASKKKMGVIPNGINVEKFDVKKEKHEGFIIGFVGRITPIKDLKTALKAVKLVSVELKDVKFLIIGPSDEEPEYYEFCLELVESLNLQDVVEFVGKANVLDYYPIMDVLLLSSISEGQPLVILEAMAAGIPVVATDVGACKELVEDEEGQSGFVVPPKDYTRLAQAILKIHKEKELASFFSANGKRIVRKKYTLEEMINSYKKMYEEVLEIRN